MEAEAFAETFSPKKVEKDGWPIKPVEESMTGDDVGAASAAI